MRLLMTADAVGGVWQYATELTQALVPHGIETTIALLGPVPADLAVPEGVTVIETGLPLDWLADNRAEVVQAAEAIAALAARTGADLVQVNSPALAAVRFPCPTVAVAHGCVATWWEAAEAIPLPEQFRWHAELMRDGLTAADTVISPSTSYAAIVQRRYSLSRSPLAVHNGRSRRAPARTDGDAAAHVLTAGRLWDRVKKTALLDRLAARLAVPFRAAGPLTAPHGESVAPAHLATLGSLSAAALAAELDARPIFVSAARFEPFGLAVLEAAQAGCALVLANIPTFRELWDGAALFVADEDEAAWTAAIERLLADPAARASLSAAARARAERYTPAACAAAMADIYAGLLSQRRAAA